MTGQPMDVHSSMFPVLQWLAYKQPSKLRSKIPLMSLRICNVELVRQYWSYMYTAEACHVDVTPLMFTVCDVISSLCWVTQCHVDIWFHDVIRPAIVTTQFEE